MEEVLVQLLLVFHFALLTVFHCWDVEVCWSVFVNFLVFLSVRTVVERHLIMLVVVSGSLDSVLLVKSRRRSLRGS